MTREREREREGGGQRVVMVLGEGVRKRWGWRGEAGGKGDRRDDCGEGGQ